MSSISVQIVMHGLIALAPIRGVDNTIQMNALAVDSRQLPPEASSCIQHMGHDRENEFHKLAIIFETTDRDCTTGRVCRKLDQVRCVCDLEGALDRMDISISPTPNFIPASPPHTPISASAPRSLPWSREAIDAGNFDYVPNLALLGFSLNQQFLEPLPPPTLAARFRFPISPQQVIACEHAVRPDDGTDNVHPLEFRKLKGDPSRGDLSQASAQKVIFDFEVEANDGQAKLVLARFDGTVRHEFALLGPAIEFLNGRVDKGYLIARLDRDDPCDDGVGRDFALFYNLVVSAPAWADRPVPHVKFTQWKAKTEIAPEACEIPKSLWSRPICPMASFDPGNIL